jgi:hypothetical protein
MQLPSSYDFVPLPDRAPLKFPRVCTENSNPRVLMMKPAENGR